MQLEIIIMRYLFLLAILSCSLAAFSPAACARRKITTELHYRHCRDDIAVELQHLQTVDSVEMNDLFWYCYLKNNLTKKEKEQQKTIAEFQKLDHLGSSMKWFPPSFVAPTTKREIPVEVHPVLVHSSSPSQVPVGSRDGGIINNEPSPVLSPPSETMEDPSNLGMRWFPRTLIR